MRPLELLEAFQRLRDRLLQHERYFAPTGVTLGPKATEQEIGEAEARLGAPLPPLLRDFYRDVGSSLYFAFEVHENAWRADGYPDVGGGEVALVSIQQLSPGRVAGLAPFLTDGIGNGWCLDLESREGRVVRHDHDDPDHERDWSLASIDELFRDGHFIDSVLLPDSDSYLSELVSTGRLPPPPKKSGPRAPIRHLPDAAVERDADHFEIVAELPEDGTIAAIAVGRDHCVAAGPRWVSVVDLRTRSVVRSFEKKRATWTLAAHPDSLRFVAGGEHGLAWHTTADDSSEIRGAGNVTALAVDSTGASLALGTRKGAVELWDYERRERRLALAPHSGIVSALAFAGDVIVSLGLDGVLQAHDLDGVKRWTASFQPSDRELGPRMLARSDEIVLASGQLDLSAYRVSDGEREQRSDESLPTASRLRSLAASPTGGDVLAGRAGARVEGWSSTGAWKWSYFVEDGSEVVGLAPLDDRHVLLVSSAGWVARLDPSDVAKTAQRRLELLAGVEEHGLEATAAEANFDPEQLMEELRKLEAALGVRLFVTPTRKKRRRATDAPELTMGAVALLCQRA